MTEREKMQEAEIERLVQAYYRESAAGMTAGITDVQERIKCIEEVVGKITGLKDFDCVRRIKAKPFAMDFDEQLDACDILYGDFRFKATFTMDDVERCVKEFEGIYSMEILERVRNTMRQQMRKYSYLF